MRKYLKIIWANNLFSGQSWVENTILCIGSCAMVVMGCKFMCWAVFTKPDEERWFVHNACDMMGIYVELFTKIAPCRRGVHQHRHRSQKRGEGLGDRCCRSACKLSELYAACWASNLNFKTSNDTYFDSAKQLGSAVVAAACWSLLSSSRSLRNFNMYFDKANTIAPTRIKDMENWVKALWSSAESSFELQE